MLCDRTADVCKKSELALFKHPARYWGTGCCSSSAGEIATSINRLHPGRFGLNPLNPLTLLLFRSTSAVALTTQEFITLPLLRILLRREISLLSSSRSLGGRPRVSCGMATTFASVLPFRLSSFNRFSSACLKVLTVLSFRTGSSFLKWQIAFELSFSLAYLPILARISAEKCVYFPRFLDEDAVEDSGVTISATLDTTALYSTSPSEVLSLRGKQAGTECSLSIPSLFSGCSGVCRLWIRS